MCVRRSAASASLSLAGPPLSVSCCLLFSSLSVGCVVFSSLLGVVFVRSSALRSVGVCLTGAGGAAAVAKWRLPPRPNSPRTRTGRRRRRLESAAGASRGSRIPSGGLRRMLPAAMGEAGRGSTSTTSWSCTLVLHLEPTFPLCLQSSRWMTRAQNHESPAFAGLSAVGDGLSPPSSADSGGGIRTRDLRVMSPTSYLAAPPRDATIEISTLKPGFNPPGAAAGAGRCGPRTPPSRC